MVRQCFGRFLWEGEGTMEETATAQRSTTRATGRTGVLVPAFLAALLGVFLIWGVGFAGPSVIHNAAHDSRHANGFPCH